MKTWHWIAGTATVILVGVIKHKAIMEAWNDIVTSERIKKLHPAIRQRAKDFIAEAARQGIKLRITRGLATWAEQQKLYDQGRTAASITKKEAIVTNARPGQSLHNYGLAIDVVEMKDGKALWNNPAWNKIGQLGKKFGFVWGGDFQSLVDKPHFEYSGGKSVSQLLAMYNAGQKDGNGYLLNIT
jgi:peptidoglycan L-alanyl-D-glutamate endopeptidase CwlK